MLRIFNTLTRTVEEIKPIEEGKIKIYTCGMTVQDAPHAGHMRVFMLMDVFTRYLEYKGFQVIHVVNFTDIDDKIIQKSKEHKIDWRIWGQRYIDEFIEVRDRLNIKPPYCHPRATQHIEEIIKLIDKLFVRGYAYKSDKGDVYFRVRKFNGYGKLSKKRLDDLIAGARVEPGEGKEDVLDFALWKSHKEGEPFWYSPWGKGRPGWHIECSAMSMHYLGETFDIHAGGEDLIFPHHENEIAQSEAATGKNFANYWMHFGLLKMGKEKMSKSTGLFVKMKDILKEIDPNAIRLYYLQSHWKQSPSFDFKLLEDAQKAWKRIENTFLRHKHIKPRKMDKIIKEFESYMDDNFNTPKVMGLIFKLLSNESEENLSALAFILKILGFKFEEEKKFEEIDKLINLIVEIRHDLRQKKDYVLADKIRDRLNQLGIILQDTKEGTKWFWK